MQSFSVIHTHVTVTSALGRFLQRWRSNQLTRLVGGRGGGEKKVKDPLYSDATCDEKEIIFHLKFSLFKLLHNMSHSFIESAQVIARNRFSSVEQTNSICYLPFAIML